MNLVDANNRGSRIQNEVEILPFLRMRKEMRTVKNTGKCHTPIQIVASARAATTVGWIALIC